MLEGRAAFNIARWNGSAWSSMDAGLNSTVHALVVRPNGYVVAGACSPLRLDQRQLVSAVGRSADWSGLGSGVNSTVYALAAPSSGELVAGGAFSTAGGVSATTESPEAWCRPCRASSRSPWIPRPLQTASSSPRHESTSAVRGSPRAMERNGVDVTSGVGGAGQGRR